MNSPLQISTHVSVNPLAQSLSDTTNSYKFYWLLAILNLVLKGQKRLSVDELVVEMICESWHPIKQFKLDHGPQDKLGASIERIAQYYSLEESISKSELGQVLRSKVRHQVLQKHLKTFSRYVPYRFLSSWFNDELRGKLDVQKNTLISKLSIERAAVTLYSINDANMIIINDNWFEYLNTNARIVHDFILYNLTRYLERKNPNTPSIAHKLYPIQYRDLSHGRKFWEIVFQSKGNMKCIYSSKDIYPDAYSIDHYLPWSFVAHDQLWNLMPVSKEINSSKGNSIPSSIYLQRFAAIHYESMLIAGEHQQTQNLLEDYATILRLDLKGLMQLSLSSFETKIIETINPLMQIAINMGFKENWIYPDGEQIKKPSQ